MLRADPSKPRPGRGRARRRSGLARGLADRSGHRVDARARHRTWRDTGDRALPAARNQDHRPSARLGATMTEPIRVLIADDHPLFRDGLTALLTEGPDTELAGAATSGTEAVDLARETQPDVVIMDLHMPGLNGIEATRRIVADSPHIAVLVLTMFDDDDSIFSALRAGARGYLLKGADQEQIRAAIHAAANGEIIFGTQLAARMLAYFTTPAAAPAPVFPQLTDREREVLDLVAQGRANPVIATRLGLSQKTVRNHVSNILTKLQVADRAQAIVQARDAGLGHQSRV